MDTVLDTGEVVVHLGDCLQVLAEMPDGSVDSVVTDPPYELAFMSKTWDDSGIAFNPQVWRECLRVLKPGGHLLAFGGTRTAHRLAVAIEDAGFKIRDSIAWMYGSGFPKSHNLKGEWQGWGTALKPAHEPIVVARKPLSKGSTVAKNVLTHGTGALNIDGCRVEGVVPATTQGQSSNQGTIYGSDQRTMREFVPNPSGRWPANVVLDETAAEELDRQSGYRSPGARPAASGITSAPGANGTMGGRWSGSKQEQREVLDGGGASRFFPVFKYQAKAPKKERPSVDGVSHPTVKPLELMRWLVRLVTPPSGVVLDPFAGSGTTLQAARDEGFYAIGIEMTADYIPLIAARLGVDADGDAA